MPDDSNPVPDKMKSTSVSFSLEAKRILHLIQKRSGLTQTEILTRLLVAFAAKVEPPIYLQDPIDEALKYVSDEWNTDPDA